MKVPDIYEAQKIRNMSPFLISGELRRQKKKELSHLK